MSAPSFKDPGENPGAFNQAFTNLWAVRPDLKGEPVMYMYTIGGVDYFKHVETREYYKAEESS